MDRIPFSGVQALNIVSPQLDSLLAQAEMDERQLLREDDSFEFAEEGLWTSILQSQEQK